MQSFLIKDENIMGESVNEFQLDLNYLKAEKITVPIKLHLDYVRLWQFGHTSIKGGSIFSLNQQRIHHV